MVFVKPSDGNNGNVGVAILAKTELDEAGFIGLAIGLLGHNSLGSLVAAGRHWAVVMANNKYKL